MTREIFTDTDEADVTRACTRKKGYPTEAVAQLSIGSIHHMNPTAEVRAYGCRHCGLWHVGGTPHDSRSAHGFATVLDDDDDDDDLENARRRSPGKPRRRRFGDRYGGR